MSHEPIRCRLDERVMTTEAWLDEHRHHQAGDRQITEADAGHPSGTWTTLACPCGARHTTNSKPTKGTA